MTNSSFRLISSATALLVTLTLSCPAPAQDILNPPQGKGHVIVFLSGMAGPKHDKALAEAIAALGYVVVVYDGRMMDEGQGQAIRSALENARQLPNALPGKAALMGVSLGGGFALAYGVRGHVVIGVLDGARRLRGRARHLVGRPVAEVPPGLVDGRRDDIVHDERRPRVRLRNEDLPVMGGAEVSPRVREADGIADDGLPHPGTHHRLSPVRP